MEAGEVLPYPMLPRKPIVSAEKIERSSENPVLKSDALPKPSAAEPARNDRVPRKSRSPFCPSPPNLADGSSTSLRIGRLDTERNTHFQSSASAGPRTGATLITSNKVLSVRLTMTRAPGRIPTPSFKVGRKEAAETLR